MAIQGRQDLDNIVFKGSQPIRAERNADFDSFGNVSNPDNLGDLPNTTETALWNYVISEEFVNPHSSFDWFAYRPYFDRVSQRYELFYPDNDEQGRTTFDISDLIPNITGTTYYVGFPNSSDSNDGLSRDGSLRSLLVALDKSDVSKVVLYGKSYVRSLSAFPSTWSPARNTVIISEGAPALLERHENLVWTLTSGNTYQATRSAVATVWDAKPSRLNSNGDYEQLTFRSGLSNVNTNPGSYWTSGSTVYVHTADSRNLSGDRDIRVFLAESAAYVTGPSTLYFENIHFYGGTSPFQAVGPSYAQSPTIYFKNCEFKYGSTNNGLYSLGATTACQDCVAAHNYRDGFNYHKYNGVLTNNWELRCVGRDNGYAGDDINNGSSTHDGMSIVRIGCKYYNNDGPNCVDVGGATAWCVSCTSYDSAAPASVQSSDFYIEGNMWLDSCVSKNPTGTLSNSRYEIVVSQTGNMNIRKFYGPKQSQSISSSGTFTYF